MDNIVEEKQLSVSVLGYLDRCCIYDRKDQTCAVDDSRTADHPCFLPLIEYIDKVPDGYITREGRSLIFVTDTLVLDVPGLGVLSPGLGEYCMVHIVGTSSADRFNLKLFI